MPNNNDNNQVSSDLNSDATNTNNLEALLETRLNLSDTSSADNVDAGLDPSTQPDDDTSNVDDNSNVGGTSNDNDQSQPDGTGSDAPDQSGEDDTTSDEDNPSDNEPDTSGLFNEEQQKVFNKAIGKVRNNLKVAKASLVAAQTENAELSKKIKKNEADLIRLREEKAMPAPDSGNPIIGIITDEDALTNYANSQYSIKQQLIDNVTEEGDSFFYDGDKKINVPSDKVRSVISRIEKTIAIDVPVALRHIQNSKQIDSWLDEIPETANPNSDISLAISTVIADLPALKRFKGTKTAAFYFSIGQRLSQKMGGKEAWEFVNAKSQKATVAPQKQQTQTVANKVPPKPIKKNVAAPILQQQQKRVDSPINSREAASLLEERFNK